MKIKLVFVTALSVASLTLALLWLMDEKVSEERSVALESGLRGSVTALSQALQADLRGLRRTLPFVSTNRNQVDWKSLKPFFGLVQLRYENGTAVISSVVTDPKGPANAWSNDAWMQTLGAWKSFSPPAGTLSMELFTDLNKNHWAGILFTEEGRVWWALAGPEILQNLIDLQKGPNSSLAIMNAQGRLLAHSTNEYVGTVAPQDSIYSKVLAETSARAFKNFSEGLADPSVAAFEKVPRTDVTVLAFRPLAQIKGERRQMLLYGGLAGFGLLLLSVSVVWIIAGREEQMQEKELALAKTISARAPEPTALPAIPATAISSVKEKNESTLRIASALGHELRSPLASILGFCQMILLKSQDRQITEPVDSILRETRTARDVIDKLLAFAGEKNDEQKPSRVELALAKVLKDFEPRLQQKQIKFRKELRDTSEIPLSLQAVEKAIRHILGNASESMDRMMKREIFVQLAETPTEISLKISDTGEGVEDSVKRQMFEPFFTSRNPNQHMGMGLPAAMGIMKEHGGDLKIESTPGKGTTATLVFPKPQKNVQIGEETVALRTEETVQIPLDLPQSLAPASSMAPLELQTHSGVSESSVEGSTGSSASPTDVDIEDLLELAEAPLKTELQKNVSPSKPATPSSQATPVSRATPPPAPVSAKPEAIETPEVENAVSAKAGDSNKINAPSFKPPEKVSKLDEVKVEVRRPGVRL